MRVCLLEVHPRINGAVTFQLHLREGFKRIGADVDLCAMTRSGKTMGAWGSSASRYTPSGFKNGWWPGDVDRVIATRDITAAAEEMSAYDLIVMTEPKAPNADRDAYDRVEEPDYLHVLREVRAPWTTVIHAPQYDFKRAPFMPELLRTPSFSGVLITLGDDYWEQVVAGFYGRLPVERVRKMVNMRNLPYVVSDDRLPTLDGMTIGMTARVVSNKGQESLCYVADRLPGPIALWGVSSQSNSPTPSFILWEKLTKDLGWESVVTPEWKIKVLPWTVRTPGGNTIEYKAAFSVEDDPYSKIGVHVSLTSRNFSYGKPEYAELEAMDHGCVPVWPATDDPPTEYSAMVLNAYKAVNDHDPDELVAGVTRGWEIARGSSTRDELVTYNRERLRKLNDPARYAARIVEEVLGK